MMNLLTALLRGIVLAALALLTFSLGLLIFGAWHDEWSGYNGQFRVSDGVCNIAVIPVHDEIASYTTYDPDTGSELLSSTLDDFEFSLRNAEHDSMIRGALISIDSPGGSPYAGEAMARALQRSPLVSAAVVRDVAASSAYWLASGADTIIASPMSDVGSIGVTASYLEYAGQNEDSGLHYVEIASGPYKDAGNPDRRLSDEELALFQANVDAVHQYFVAEVAKNRNLPVERVAKLADGSTLLGSAALPAGLIDALGDKETAREWFAGELGIPVEEVVFCE